MRWRPATAPASDSLGRSGPVRRSRLRPDESDRRGAGQAVRLQLRLSRLLPAAARLGQLRARPAALQPRVHEPRADVPGLGQARGRRARRAGGGRRGTPSARGEARTAGRRAGSRGCCRDRHRRGDRQGEPRGADARADAHRDDGAQRLDHRGQEGERALGGGAGQPVRPPDHARHGDADLRPGRRARSAEDQLRPDRHQGVRHHQQLRRRQDAVGHGADGRGKFPRLFRRRRPRGHARGRELQALRRPPAQSTPGSAQSTGSTWPRSRTSRTAMAGWSSTIPTIPTSDAGEAHRARPLQARGRHLHRQQGRPGRALLGRRRALRVPLSVRDRGHVRPGQSRGQRDLLDDGTLYRSPSSTRTR